MSEHDLAARAVQVLGGMPATYSKSTDLTSTATALPVAVESGCGPYVYDIHGKRYIDTTASLGPILLGYGHHKVAEALTHSSLHGTSLPAMTTLEVQVAERLVSMIPAAELVRFGVNGSDTTQAAIRIARQVTGYQHVIKCGYHGFVDFSIADTPKNGGVLDAVKTYSHSVTWGNTTDLNTMLDLFPRIAAIIFEVPPLSEYTDDQLAWGTQLQAKAASAGGLLIWDEIVTGFREHPRGLQFVWGMTPDLACFSKALGNGAPIAALVGRRDLMATCITGPVFMSSTFSGCALGLSAASATLSALLDDHEWEQLLLHGRRFARELAALATQMNLPVEIVGNHARIRVTWQDGPAGTGVALRAVWAEEMAKRGVLVQPKGGLIFPMTCWDEPLVNALLQAAGEVFALLREVTEGRKALQDVCQGPVPQDVFAVRS